ncbi:copper homeostasis protein CutC [Vibrio ostreicida]|uniref:PF03932 family protein CutC n=1 Tax=Vibrio ostreicida TaxID=526588 RepID=A0ABT8BUH6_9VIBR|nr:copper homeostasis protein CutC [Vibrio ostreicida]MDN3610817.1 copper homeostasis protein CutC [Vibrio ostreicida]NPD07193.1 copper homeostasis protein CutC [Vibrio ostreicida]
MKYVVEVCIDNLESLHFALTGGADRIELCSSLTLGGLTPSFGFMKQAAALSSVPIYAMIRPRQGDFLYNPKEIECMLIDIEAAALAGLQGVVIGVLTEQGNIDTHLAAKLVKKATAHHLGVTFHRAIDQCSDYTKAIEDVAKLGCERILTSGTRRNVDDGVKVLQHMVELAKGRFTVMAGAGLTAENAKNIVQTTGIKEVHLSGKSSRPSKMKTIHSLSKMGDQALDDFVIPITSSDNIAKVVKALSS